HVRRQGDVVERDGKTTFEVVGLLLAEVQRQSTAVEDLIDRRHTFGMSDRPKDCERVVEFVVGGKLGGEGRVLAGHRAGDICGFETLEIQAYTTDQRQPVIPDVFVLGEDTGLEIRTLRMRARGGA